MGFRVAWVAVKGKSFDAVIAELELVRTGEFDRWPDAEFSGLTLPSGWVLVLNYFSMGELILDRDLDAVKAGAEIVTCYLNETTMVSRIAAFRDRAELWSVGHDCEKGADHLDVSGTPPEPFAAIREEVLQQRASDDGVDFVFDAAIGLGEAITGFRHDHDLEGLGEEPYELLEPRRIVDLLRRMQV